MSSTPVMVPPSHSRQFYLAHGVGSQAEQRLKRSRDKQTNHHRLGEQKVRGVPLFGFGAFSLVAELG